MKHRSFFFFFDTDSYDVSPELLISDLRFSTGSGKNSLCQHKQIIQVVHIQLEKKKKSNLQTWEPRWNLSISKDECGERWDGLLSQVTSGRKAWETDTHTSQGWSDGSSGPVSETSHLPSLDGVCRSTGPWRRSAFCSMQEEGQCLGLEDNLAMNRHHISFFLSFLSFCYNVWCVGS